MMISGRWTEEDREIEAGAFVRCASRFGEDLPNSQIEALGADPDRFQLIASLSCPWSHRTTIVRALKGLSVPWQIAHGPRVQGYAVNGGEPWRLPGTDEPVVHLHQVYAASDPTYGGRVTVPVLWDSATRRIVSNESAKIARAFDAVRRGGDSLDFTLMPAPLRAEISALCDQLQDDLFDAVYRAGLAQRQDVYEQAVAQVFATLERLERRLSGQRYLFGVTVTEADWWLFATLVRFDAVYHSHFRCTRRRVLDYPSLWAYARDLFAWRGVAETVDLAAIREGYYRNDGSHNPFGIVAAAPEADWYRPHGRESLGPAAVVRRDGSVVEVDPVTLTVLAG